MPGAKQSEPRKRPRINSAVAPERNGAGYLRALGGRIRELRSQRGMTRKVLAAQSGVSERFLAQVEAGGGNASVLVLHHIAGALEVPLELVVGHGPEPSVEMVQAAEALRNLNAEELRETQRWLGERFGQSGAKSNLRRQRIALVGLRGAGKSTLGAMLARQLGCPFIELDRLVETASGGPLSSIFDLYGQEGFRRMERRCLDEVLAQHPRFVLATGGSLVTAEGTFQRLLQSCFTVWLKAAPEDHMRRVIAQGDTRPMADNPEAMSDLNRILLEREPLYGKADLAIDTSGRSLEAAVSRVLKSVG